MNMPNTNVPGLEPRMPGVENTVSDSAVTARPGVRINLEP